MINKQQQQNKIEEERKTKRIEPNALVTEIK